MRHETLSLTQAGLTSALLGVRKSVDGPLVSELVAFKPEVARWLRGIYAHPDIGADQPIKFLRANLENRYRNTKRKPHACLSLLILCRDVLAAIDEFNAQHSA